MAIGTSKTRTGLAPRAKLGATARAIPADSELTRRRSGDVHTEIQIQPGGLDHYLAMVGDDGGNPRFKCYDGSILLVSPSNRHELASEHIAALIAAVCSILRIPCRPLASTTLRMKGQDKGIEPDKGFYIQNFEAMQGRPEIDLAIDPPPDLIVEIVWSHPATRSLGFAREMRIPEVWIYDVTKRDLSILHLQRSGKKSAEYRPAEASLAFPFLTIENILSWTSDGEIDLGAFDRKVRRWIRAELAPRVRDQKKSRPS